jgi:hypothetical protein
MPAFRKIFQRRYPAYFAGFTLSLALVLMILQAKNALAPDFQDVPDKRLPIELISGGSLRLKLGPEPGKLLAWGFPTQLAIGRKHPDGHTETVIHMEYRDLVQSETLLGPLTEIGEYELIAQFYACLYPGEKYCARVQLDQPLLVFGGGEAPAEVDLSVDLKAAAEKAAQARPTP